MKPQKVKIMSFQQVISDAEEQQKKNIEYVKKTGKCINCKKNKVVKYGYIECQECIDKKNKLLKELSKDPGFFQLGIQLDE